jgi:hypothetical protein
MDKQPVMVGGAKLHTIVMEWSKQSSNLFYSLFMISLVLYAAYAEKMPIEYRYQLSSPLGRALLLLLLYIVMAVGGWIPALLFGIAMALTWSNRPLVKPVGVQEEGFENGKNEKKEGFQDNVKKTKVQGHRWFVERTLYENPHRIIQDRISTFAVQDDNQNPNGRTSK